jgi:NH3-dependent NAD+ synthetase
MTTRPEVESAIKQLPKSEVYDLAKWLQDYLDEIWDQQIEADLASGKLDHLIAQAEQDIAANNVRDLDEILCNG